VALVSVPLLYPVEFGMDALCPLLAHYPESNSTPLPDPRCHVVLKEMELGGHSCMWVRLSVVLKEGLYVCFCRLNTTFIASIPEKRTYQELISLLLRGVLVAVFVVACCKQGVNELSTECSARFQKGWALLCHCHHRLTQCVDVFSLDAECDIASSNDYVYVYLETPMNMVAYKRPTIVGFTLDIEALESSAEAYDERTFLHPEAFLYVTLDLINLSVLLCIICI
jgi:hypothetical protein